jgi:hypothetical protein
MLRRETEAAGDSLRENLSRRRDRASRARGRASTAVNALLGVNGISIASDDSFRRAGILAATAANASGSINLVCHFNVSFLDV